jgi:hypothetical protein
MRFSLHKFQLFLLALCVLVLVLNQYELTFAVWFLTALVTARKSYSGRILKFLILPGIILLIAIISAFFQYHKSYNYARDVAYLLKPILGLVIGYNVCKSVGTKTLMAIVYTGLALAVIHIATLAFYYTVFAIRTVHELRHYGGYFNDFEIYVLILLLFRKQFGIDIGRYKASLFIAIIVFSGLLYFARTNMIQFVILFMALKGYLRVTKKSVTVLVTAIVLIGSAYAAIYYYNPQRRGPGIEAFLYKIKIAPLESFKTRINQDDWKEFNDNYRSFENIMTVRQVSGNSTLAVVIGEGLGATVDIGREMWSNDGELIRYMPVLHNANMTVFLKSGLVGVFFLWCFIFYLYRQGHGGGEKLRYVNYLIVGSAIFLVVSNWIFMGLYLKLDSKSIFFGFLICYKELLVKQNRLKQLEDAG